MRRFGEPVKAGQRYATRPGAYAILLRGADLLLTHQMEPRSEFQLPGGGIDPGESPVQALRREVFEETGWHIAAPRRLGVYKRFTYMPEYDRWAEKICTIYLARPTRKLGPPSEPGHSAIWMPVAVAVNALSGAGDRAFAELLL